MRDKILVIYVMLILGMISFLPQGSPRDYRLCRVGLDYIDAFAVENTEDILAKFLRSSSVALKIRASLAVATLKVKTPRIVAALQKNQHSRDRVIKAYSDLVLALIKGTLTKERLQRYLDSPRLQIRTAAVRIIGRSGKKNLLEWLREVFEKEKSEVVKAEIVDAWGRNGYKNAEEEIAEALGASLWLLRNAAVTALGDMDIERGKNIFIAMLRNEKKGVIRANLKILLSEAGVFVSADEEELNSTSAQLKGSSLVALANLDRREVLKTAKEILADRNAKETLRYYAAEALAIFRRKINISLDKAYINSDYLTAQFRNGKGVAIEDILAQDLLSESVSIRKTAYKLILVYYPKLVYFLMGLHDESPLVIAQALAVQMDRFVQRNWAQPPELKARIIEIVGKRCIKNGKH